MEHRVADRTQQRSSRNNEEEESGHQRLKIVIATEQRRTHVFSAYAPPPKWMHDAGKGELYQSDGDEVAGGERTTSLSVAT